MKLLRLALLLAAVICTPFSYAACSLATLKGNFALSGTIDTFGFVGDGSESNLVFLMGVINFDGLGKLTLRNGKISIAGIYANTSGGGSYRLNGNCTGNASISITVKIPNQPNAPEQPGVKTKIRLDMVVSGTASNPRVDAVYTDIQEIGESGIFSLTKIKL